MKNKYYFDDFTEANYTSLLLNAKKRYEFITYNSIDKHTTKKEFILWRHDVDFSVHRAFALAKIEKNMGIKSTYFFQLGSAMYNLFEQEIKELVFKIMKLGHEVGLHFDCSQYRINTKDDLEKYLIFEKNIIEKLFDVEIHVFSFHNPTEDVLKNDEYKYANMINTYARYFKEDIVYCSDSNGYWRYERLEDFLTKELHKNRQVLTHPEWWQIEIMSPRARVQRCLMGRMQQGLLKYDNFLRKNGRENVK